MCVLALAFWATYETLWRQEKQHTSRNTGSGYRVSPTAPGSAPPGSRIWQGLPDDLKGFPDNGAYPRSVTSRSATPKVEVRKPKTANCLSRLLGAQITVRQSRFHPGARTSARRSPATSFLSRSPARHLPPHPPGGRSFRRATQASFRSTPVRHPNTRTPPGTSPDPHRRRHPARRDETPPGRRLLAGTWLSPPCRGARKGEACGVSALTMLSLASSA